jgi:hypothetical protein
MLIALSLADEADPAEGLALEMEAAPRVGEGMLVGQRLYRVRGVVWLVDRAEMGELAAAVVLTHDPAATKAFGTASSLAAALRIVWDRDCDG